MKRANINQIIVMAAADAIVTIVDRKKLARYGGNIDITEHYCVESDFQRERTQKFTKF